MIYNVECDSEILTVKSDNSSDAIVFAIEQRNQNEIYDVTKIHVIVLCSDDSSSMTVHYETPIDAPNKIRNLIERDTADGEECSATMTMDKWDELHPYGVISSTDCQG